ncbi:MAG: hypothetical protein Q9179_007959, partial [Wetmoreana sp. 5 TL-2023]
MAPTVSKKRKHEAITRPKTQRPIKKFKKQTYYSSPSSSSASADEVSDFPAVDLADSGSESDLSNNTIEDFHESENESPTSTKPQLLPRPQSSSPSTSDSEASSSSSNIPSDPSSPAKDRQKSKRNDPTSFATSITSILSSKLPSKTRSDPVLARSSSAAEANTAIREAQLEKRARAQIRAEKKAMLEKGRVKDVLLGTAVGEKG